MSRQRNCLNTGDNSNKLIIIRNSVIIRKKSFSLTLFLLKVELTWLTGKIFNAKTSNLMTMNYTPTIVDHNNN